MPSAVRLRLSTLIPTIALLALSPLAVAAEWPYDYAIKAVAWDGDLPTLSGQPTRSSDTAMSGNGWIAATVKVTANETLTGTVMRRDPANGTWTDIDYPTDATYGFRHDRCDIVINNNGTIALTVEANVSPSGMDLIAYRRVGDSGWTLPTSTTRTSQAWRLETNGNRFLGGRAADAPSNVLLPVTWSDSFAYTDVSGNFPGLHVGNVDGLYGNGAMVVWASQTEDTNEDYRWSFISDITTGSPTITHLTKLSSPAITRTVPVSGGGTATAADIHDTNVTSSHLIFAWATAKGAEDTNGVAIVPLSTLGAFTGVTAVPRPRVGDLCMKLRGVNSSGLIAGEAGPFLGSTTAIDRDNQVSYLYRIGDAASRTAFQLSGWDSGHLGDVAEDNALLDGPNLFVPVPTVNLTGVDTNVGPADTVATVRLTRSAGSLLLPLNLTISLPSGVTASDPTPTIAVNATTVDVTLTIPTTEVGEKTISLDMATVPGPGGFWGKADSAYNRGSNQNVVITNANVVNNPTATITRTGGSGTIAKNQTANIRVVFSAPVTGFIAAELEASTGTISGFVGSGTTYDAVWTPDDNVDASSVSFDVDAGRAQTGTGSNLVASTLVLPFDTLAPAAPTITSPTNGDTIGANPTVSGTLPSGATSVSVTVGATIQAATISGGWSTSFTGLGSGSTAISATATDAAGNISTISSITVTVDNSPPNLTVGIITSPTADATVAVSGWVGETVDLTTRDGATVVHTTLGVPANNWGPFETSILADGAHSLTVRAANSLGNTTTSTVQVVTVDTTGPTVTLGTPSAIAVNSSATPTIVATYADATTAVASISLASVAVQLTGDAAATAAITVSGANSRTITLSGLTGDGTVTVQVDTAGTALDTLGNAASVSAISTVITVDNTAPAVAITTAATTTNDQTPTITGTAEEGRTVELREGGTLLGSAVATGGNWSIDTTTLSAGVHTLVATAVDAAGNIGTSGTVAITIDLTPPAVAISTVAGATNDTTPTITGTAETGATVQLREGATVLGSAVASGGTWSITSSALAEGVHNLLAQATDTAGNVATTSAVAITVDTTAPGLAFGAPSATVNVNADDTVTIVVTYSDAGSGLGTVTLANGDVNVTTASGNATATAAVSGSGSTRTITLTGFTGDGTITVGLDAGTATDAAGNSAAVAGPSAIITVDNTVPVVAIATGTTITADTTPTISGTSDDNGATIELRDGSTVLGTGTVTAGVWSVTPGTALAAGTYNLTARGTDLAGNVGSNSAAVQIIVNLGGPTVTISGGSVSGTTATFTATFSAAVAGLVAGDIIIGGTAGGTKTVTISADATNRIFTITVQGLAAPSGTVTVSIPADVASEVSDSDPTQASNVVTATFTVPTGGSSGSTAGGDDDGGGCGAGGALGLIAAMGLLGLRRRQRR